MWNSNIAHYVLQAENSNFYKLKIFILAILDKVFFYLLSFVFQ